MTPLPSGFRIALDSSTRSLRGGRILVGEGAGRAVRLTAAGAAAVREMQRRGDLSPAARSLGRLLVHAGLAHPRPPDSASAANVTVVIPVRDRDLEACLSGVDPSTPVVVVDDGSHDADKVAAVCRRHGATLIRRDQSGGPAAARNMALSAAKTDLVAFLDSDCVPEPGWLRTLVRHFADPLVGAVAPRLMPAWPGRPLSVLRRFASVRPPLDMGPAEGRVAPGTRVAYVPSAALVVRRRALREPFDPGLRYGEDVDLVWRLHDAGWQVRYDPAAIVKHSEPDTWSAWLHRRRRYGSSAAALSRRHPGRLAPAVLRPWPTTAAGLVLARRPLAALLVMSLPGAMLARRLHPLGIPVSRALLWSAKGVHETLVGAGRAATILAAPALLAAIRSRRWRLAALTLLTLPPLDQWLRHRPDLDPARWTLACIADDIAYGVGVWQGSLREREIGPLLPLTVPIE